MNVQGQDSLRWLDLVEQSLLPDSVWILDL